MSVSIVIGHVGVGKSLYGACQAIQALENGKIVFANMHISYETSDKRKVKFVGDMAKLVDYLKKKRTPFPLNSCLLILDEAYLFMDSRTSNSAMNNLVGEFILQSRKLGFDLLLISQLASALDKRARNIADRFVIADKIESLDEYGEKRVDFRYTYLDHPEDSEMSEISYTMIPFESAKFIWQCYSTQEIQQRSKLSDKEIAAIQKQASKAYEEIEAVNLS